MSEVPRLSETYSVADRPVPETRLGDLITEGAAAAGVLRRVAHPKGEALVYGNCLASDDALEGAVDMALRTGDHTALTELPGSYATLLTEPERLTALADLAGQYPLYYRNEPDGGLAFGLSAGALNRGAASAALDTVTAAAHIALPNSIELLGGRTMIEGTSMLPAGHRLRLGTDGEVSVAPYESFEVPTVATFDEAAALLREALVEAAELRAASGRPLSADFSGGLDSTTAAYLVAQALHEPLTVATRYTPGLPSEDLEQARRLLALPASADLFSAHEYAYPDTSAPYADMLNAPVLDEPNPGLIAHGRDRPYIDFLRRHGSQAHITGVGADFLFNVEPSAYLGGLARAGRYGAFARSAIETGRLSLQSPVDIAREGLRRNSFTPAKSMRMLSRILQGDQGKEALQYGSWMFGLSTAPEWLTSHARRELAGIAEARAVALGEPPEGFDVGNYLAYMGVRDEAHGEQSARRLAGSMGVQRESLYMDNPVLRACVRMPSHLRQNPWVFKALLAKAVEGLVPAEVTARATKGDYLQSSVNGLRAALPDFEALLQNSRLAEMGIIDPAAVRRTFDRAKVQAFAPVHSLQHFAAMEQWLQHQERMEPGAGGPPVAPPPEPQDMPRPALDVPAESDVFGMPPDAHMVTCPTGAVALNVQTGQYHRYDNDAVRVLHALRLGRTFGGAVEILHQANPQRSVEAIRDTIATTVQWLSDKGILAADAPDIRIRQGTATKKYVQPPLTRQNDEKLALDLRDIPAALGGIAVAGLLQKRPLATRLRVIEFIHKHGPQRLLRADEGTRLMSAVKRLSEYRLGRAACLEVSTATAVAAALKRGRLDFVMGVATDPDYHHAWPEAGGVPVRTANDPEVVGIFDVLVRV